jgi:uncharacterized membrane protein
MASEEKRIENVAVVHAHAQQSIGRQQRAIERVTAWVGRPRMLYVVIALIGGWVVLNASLSKPIDPPPFAWMQVTLALYAAVVTTMVLVAQTRQSKHGEQRSYLDLQVNLLAEQKTAKVISLLEELRRDMPSVKNRPDAQADEMAHELDTHAVLHALEDVLEDKASPGDKR